MIGDSLHDEYIKMLDGVGINFEYLAQLMIDECIVKYQFSGVCIVHCCFDNITHINAVCNHIHNILDCAGITTNYKSNTIFDKHIFDLEFTIDGIDYGISFWYGYAALQEYSFKLLDDKLTIL